MLRLHCGVLLFVGCRILNDALFPVCRTSLPNMTLRRILEIVLPGFLHIWLVATTEKPECRFCAAPPKQRLR